MAYDAAGRRLDLFCSSSCFLRYIFRYVIRHSLFNGFYEPMPKEMRATKTNLKRLFFTCRFQWSFFTSDPFANNLDAGHSQKNNGFNALTNLYFNSNFQKKQNTE